MRDTIPDGLEKWHRFVNEKDEQVLAEALADNVLFHSPFSPSGILKQSLSAYGTRTYCVYKPAPDRSWIMTEDQGLVWVTLPKNFEILPGLSALLEKISPFASTNSS